MKKNQLFAETFANLCDLYRSGSLASATISTRKNMYVSYTFVDETDLSESYIIPICNSDSRMVTRTLMDLSDNAVLSQTSYLLNNEEIAQIRGLFTAIKSNPQNK